MAWQPTTLKTLIDRGIAETNARIKNGYAQLRNSVLNVLVHVVAAGVSNLYGYLQWLALQLMIDTADAEYLERWASIWGIYRRQATNGVGKVVLSGNVGSFVPAGTLLQRPDGQQYKTIEEGMIGVDKKLVVGVVALSVGVIGNALASVSLSLISPVEGVASTALVDDASIAGGVDTEKDESLRARLLDRVRNPPHGGSKADYVKWAKEVAGVTRVWVWPRKLGKGTVLLHFVCDNDPSGIFPGEQKRAEVYEHVFKERPVTAEIFIESPVPDPLDFVISGLVPYTAAVREAIEAELKDLILREAEPGGTLLISHIREAISAAVGEHDHVLESPDKNIVCEFGRMITMGKIQWQ